MSDGNSQAARGAVITRHSDLGSAAWASLELRMVLVSAVPGPRSENVSHHWQNHHHYDDHKHYQEDHHFDQGQRALCGGLGG